MILIRLHGHFFNTVIIHVNASSPDAEEEEEDYFYGQVQSMQGGRMLLVVGWNGKTRKTKEENMLVK